MIDMMQTLFRHKLALVLIAILIAGGIWYGLSQPSPSSSASLVTTQAAAGTDPASATLVSTLLSLRAVTLDGTIFSDPSFISLKDFTTAIVPEPVGRSDPFAPLSASASASASSMRTAQIFTPRATAPASH